MPMKLLSKLRRLLATEHILTWIILRVWESKDSEPAFLLNMPADTSCRRVYIQGL